MGLWCITSLEIQPLFEVVDRPDPYLLELAGAEKYALTEICIGEEDKQHFFELYRDDIGTLKFTMQLRRLFACEIPMIIKSVEFLNNPAKWTDNYKIQITFDAHQNLLKDIRWQFTYLGTGLNYWLKGDESLIQEFKSVVTGPVKKGRYKFQFETGASDSTNVSDVKENAILILKCFYGGSICSKIAWFVKNTYEAKDKPEKPIFDKREIDTKKIDTFSENYIKWPSSDGYDDEEETESIPNERVEVENVEIKHVLDDIIDIAQWDVLPLGPLDPYYDPFSNITKEEYVKKIRVRNIKNTAFRTLTKQEKIIYQKYIQLIENLAEGDSEKREEAFEEIGPLDFGNNKNIQISQEDDIISDTEMIDVNVCDDEPMETNVSHINSIKNNEKKRKPMDPQKRRQKSLNQRKTDLISAVNNICHPPDYDIENLIKSTRYNQHAPRTTEIRTARINDQCLNYIRDFKRTLVIEVRGIMLKDVNYKWFEGGHLKELLFKDVQLFEQYGALERFEIGIQKCQKLNFLQLESCKIDDTVCDRILKVLPKSIKILDLDGNNFTKLTSSISRLNKLKYFYLSNNVDLSILPWNELPLSISELSLMNTNLDQIPPTISRLNLRKFKVSSNRLKYIPWDFIGKNSIELLTIKCGGECNLPQTCFTAGYRLSFTFNNANLTDIIWDKLPPAIEALSMSLNKVSDVTCPIQFDDLRQLVLKKNNIKSVEWETLRIKIPNMKELNFAKNEISNVCWDMLPPLLTKLNLSFNPLKTMSEINQLESLESLFLDSAELENLPPGLENLPFLRRISAVNNRLKSLPVGFEGIPNLDLLDLSRNEFGYNDMEESLWNRLPQNIWELKLNHNRLKELPCQLSGMSWCQIEAVDCHLSYICPQLYHSSSYGESSRRLNISLNQELQHLSFVPKRILYPPYKRTPPVVEDDIDGYISEWGETNFLVISNKSFLNTERWQTTDKIHRYPFDKLNISDIEKQRICHCCARCGIKCPENHNTNQQSYIQQIMVMDFCLVINKQIEKICYESRKKVKDMCAEQIIGKSAENVCKENAEEINQKTTEENEEEIAEKITEELSTPSKSYKHEHEFDNIFQGSLKWFPGTWKTIVRTKMCENCIIKMKEDVIEFYNEFNRENNEHEEQPHKRKTKTASSAINVLNRKLKNAKEKQLRKQENKAAANSDTFYPTENEPDLGEMIQILQPSRPEPVIIWPDILLLQNVSGTDCFLISAVNVIDLMEALKNSFCFFATNYVITGTQLCLFRILTRQVTNVDELRQTLPLNATNEQEDAASVLWNLVTQFDENSKSLLEFNVKVTRKCKCGSRDLNDSTPWYILPVTTTKSKNSFKTLINKWINNVTNKCSICRSNFTEEHVVTIGNNQRYFIIEINSWSNRNGKLQQNSISSDDLNQNSQHMFNIPWVLIGAIEHIGDSKSGHYVTWKKFGNEWIIIDDNKQRLCTSLQQDLKCYKVLIFEQKKYHAETSYYPQINPPPIDETFSQTLPPIDIFSQSHNHCTQSFNPQQYSMLQENYAPSSEENAVDDFGISYY